MNTFIIYIKRIGPNGTVSYDSHFIWSRERFLKGLLEECAKQNEEHEKQFKEPGQAAVFPIEFAEYLSHKGGKK